MYQFTESKYPSHVACSCPIKCLRSPSKFVKLELKEGEKVQVKRFCDEPWPGCQRSEAKVSED